MTMIATSRRRNTRSVRWLSISHRGTRSESRLPSQITRHCPTLDPVALDKSHLIMRRTLFGRHGRRRPLHSDPSSSALNSP